MGGDIWKVGREEIRGGRATLVRLVLLCGALHSGSERGSSISKKRERRKGGRGEREREREGEGKIIAFKTTTTTQAQQQ